MVELSDEQFEEFINFGIAAIPKLYQTKLENVAFLVEDYPTQEQRIKLNLYPNETLFGLYEGVPLPRRNGTLKLLPDKITIFKKPIEAVSATPEQAREQVRHTIWHEVAHYYGLDHQRIHKIDGRH
jgi:predicted Zn-dependent protease with MMP-like domain